MDDARELRQQGIRAAKAGQKDEARRLLQQSLRLEPDSEPAWLWLASVASNTRERVFCLNKVLEINPNNDTALKALEGLNEPPPTAGGSTRSTGTMAAVRPGAADVPEQQPGVPIPPPDRIAAIIPEVERIARVASTPIPKRANWQRKTRNRAGEGDIVVYRAQVAITALIVLVLIGVGFVFAVQTNDDLRGIVLGPSATPTPSPTVTPTFTPGLSATPSVTPRISPTPSLTPPPNIPAASPPFLPRATALYPPVRERFVIGAAELIDSRRYPQAIATLGAEREQNIGTTFDPTIYYYLALALAREGRFTTALQRLGEADERLGTRPENIAAIRPYLDSAYAQVFALQAEAIQSGATTGVLNDALNGMRTRANDAINGDPRLAPPYLILARDAARSRRFADAIEILNRGLNVDALAGNTDLMMEKARVYVEQRNFDAALYQLFLVHYVDPSIEAAYDLKIQIAYERNRPSDAVMAAQDYLLYYPGLPRAYRLLGEAYEREGKPETALTIYTRGLNARNTDADTVAMLRARAAIYRQTGDLNRAISDYTRLLDITDEPEVRLLRMQASVEAGRYADALQDAEALVNAPGVGQGVVNLVRGRALVESGTPGDTAVFQRAAGFLENASTSADTAAPALRGMALEYLARARFELRNYAGAREAIDNALRNGETLSRRYWRGRISEAERRTPAAIEDYEFVAAVGLVVPSPFRADAAERAAALRGG